MASLTVLVDYTLVLVIKECPFGLYRPVLVGYRAILVANILVLVD